jgi:tetratricopeptide (TPR) repeat protein
MRVESIVFSIAGIVFGFIVGWIVGAQQASQPSPVTTTASPVLTSEATNQTRQPPVLDEDRVRVLTTIIENDPQQVDVKVQLANLYYNAEQFEDAIGWYEAALAIDESNIDASTDLGVSYYYTSQADRALKQFDYSLSIDPNHVSTLLNQGIVRAFGKRDLDGAIVSLERVVEVAPTSQEAQVARQAIESLKAVHSSDTGVD